MRRIWTNSPSGISGNDDLGAMSSWYVWSALGLYPLYPGRAELVIGSPLFPPATIDRPGGRIYILGGGAAPVAPFVPTLSVHPTPSDPASPPATFISRRCSLLFSLRIIPVLCSFLSPPPPPLH